MKQANGSDKDSVIYSTYQSLPKIIEAMKKHPEFEFDITFADEAHKSTGKEVIRHVFNSFTVQSPYMGRIKQSPT